MSAARTSRNNVSPQEAVSQLLRDIYELRLETSRLLEPSSFADEPDVERYRETLERRQERFEEMEETLRELQRRYLEAEQRWQNVLRANRSIWSRPTGLDPSKIPRFVPIEDRPTAPGGGKTRIVSFINLKGGVGKTTLTANLVAAFAVGNFRDLDGQTGRPARVLAVDLDFQGTLSQRCVSPQTLLEASKNNLVSSRLLDLPSKAKFEFDDLSVPFLGSPEAELIPANEFLDDKDVKRLNQLASGRQETRFYHRLWFHRDEVFRRYDFVFFDCPPRLTASSVCALVASDFVFTPTAPESFDVNAVSRTLNWLGKTRKNLELPVRFGGAILNRANNEKGLTAKEENNKTLVKLAFEDVRENFSDAPNFSAVLDAFVPRRSGANYVNGVDGGALPGANAAHFHRLATEIFRRLAQ